MVKTVAPTLKLRTNENLNLNLILLFNCQYTFKIYLLEINKTSIVPNKWEYLFGFTTHHTNLKANHTFNYLK